MFNKYTLLIIAVILMAVSCNQIISDKQTNQKNIEEFFQINTENLEKGYVTSGNQLLCIGWQNGTFPDMGWHVKGEMGGVWAQPIKLLDGFSLSISDLSNDKSETFEANKFTTFPYYNQLIANFHQFDIDIICEQFIPLNDRALEIKYTLVNNSNKACSYLLNFEGVCDLRSGFFSKEKGIVNGIDSIWFDETKNAIVAKDLSNNWSVIIASNEVPENYKLNQLLDSDNSTINRFTTEYKIEIPANGSITKAFYIAGSDKGVEPALHSMNNMMQNSKALKDEKKMHYANLIKTSAIDIPDKKMQEVYNWVRFNNEWLILNVPEIGKGIVAGIPYYTWWFGCDNSYSLQGVLATGNFDLAKSTLGILKKYSEQVNGNGRIIHEIVPSGGIVNPGNTQETPHFIIAVYKTWMWTGDEDFLKEFYPYVTKGIHWLLNDMDKNQNLFPEGPGIMEVKGLNAELIDVAVYTQQALECASKMANYFDEGENEKYYKKIADALKEKINSLFWDEKDQLYCDFYGTARQAKQVAKGAIEQYRPKGDDAGLYELNKGTGQLEFYEDLISYFNSFPSDYEHGWSTNRNWVINTPMETGIAPYDKAILALDRMEKSDFTSQYGPYLSAVNKTHSMTISTGVQAVAECRYGRIDKGLKHVNQIVNTFNNVMPGSISEMMPDYGCFTQEWTIYGMTVPLIEYVFGIQPNAPEKSVSIAPQIPTGWDNYSVSNQKIGNTSFDLSINRSLNQTTYEIRWKNKSWTSTLILPYDSDVRYEINGKQILPDFIDDTKVGFKNSGDVQLVAHRKY